MNLNEIGEFCLIRRIQKKWGGKRGGKKRQNILLGIGDDAAAVLPTPGKALLFTTDILLEKIHFDLSFLTSFFHVGYKAVSVNVSDIAAMGGRPLFFLVSLGLSGKETVADIDQLYRGMNQASREAKISLIGGNTTYSPAGLFVSLTLLGEVSKKEVITRSGGAPTDSLYVTGTLGDAAAGLEILKNRRGNADFRPLIQRYQTPKARWKEGRLLAQQKIPSAMIDISDGLSSDLLHLANQSGVGAELMLTEIPISSSLRRYAHSIGADPTSYALHGGEDYALLFSVPEKNRRKVETLIQKGVLSAQPIGRLIEKGRGFLIKGVDGQIRKLNPHGHDHFPNKPSCH